MSSKHSISATKRWAKVPKRERSEKGRQMAIAKHSQMTDEERSEHAKKMSLAKKGKKSKVDK